MTAKTWVDINGNRYIQFTFRINWLYWIWGNK